MSPHDDRQLDVVFYHHVTDVKFKLNEAVNVRIRVVLVQHRTSLLFDFEFVCGYLGSSEINSSKEQAVTSVALLDFK